MRAANLQLDSYFVEEISFRIAPTKREFTETRDPEGQDLKTEVVIGENKVDPLSKLCRLTVRVSEKSRKLLPYDFKVVLVGFFNLNENCPEQLREDLLLINSPSILYTAARELLLLLSSRSPLGPVMLPTVVFPGAQKLTSKNSARETPTKVSKRVGKAAKTSSKNAPSRKARPKV